MYVQLVKSRCIYDGVKSDSEDTEFSFLTLQDNQMEAQHFSLIMMLQ